MVLLFGLMLVFSLGIVAADQASYGVRRFNAVEFTSGESLLVSINVHPLETVNSYALEDTPPAGWSVNDISGGGVYDEVNGKVKWGLFFDNESRQFNYSVIPNSSFGEVEFSGVVSFDGVNIDIGGRWKISGILGEDDDEEDENEVECSEIDNEEDCMAREDCTSLSSAGGCEGDACAQDTPWIGCRETEDEDDDSNETEDEIEVMEHTRGAEMRLLQLEKAIKRRVLWGNAVIDRLQEKNINTTELEGIISDLDGLTDDVEAEIDALGTKSKNETVRGFIRIKMEAKNLTKEFRQTARPLLNASDNSALRVKFSELDRDELDELKNRIRERHREFNSERLGDLIDKLGIDGDEIVQKYENGEITLDEALKMVKEEFKGEVEEERERIRERLMNGSEEIEERASDRI